MQNIILRKAILTAMVAALLCGTAQCQTLQRAEPQPAFRMACIFTDHMVLQRDQPLPVWGWAAPGRAVTVEVGPHSARTRANAEGRWRVTLPSLESGNGPLTMTVKAGDETIRLTDILVGDDKPLDCFEIAGEDGKFVKAQAVIDGNTIVVSSDAIAKPTAARFAWHQEAVPNLVNKEGLPASPFRTHHPVAPNEVNLVPVAEPSTSHVPHRTQTTDRQAFLAAARNAFIFFLPGVLPINR